MGAAVAAETARSVVPAIAAALSEKVRRTDISFNTLIKLLMEMEKKKDDLKNSYEPIFSFYSTIATF